MTSAALPSPTRTAADPAQSWMDAFRALWADATPEVMRAAREYVQLMASPEEAVRDLGGPLPVEAQPALSAAA